MADERIDRILDAAYTCFARHGVRRTTMDDIAAAADMSRPAVYQYVRNKEDAFRQLGNRIFDGALDRARAAAATDRPLADRLYDVLSAKLELTLKLLQESPHAAELLDAGTRLSGELVDTFVAGMRTVITDMLTPPGPAATPAVDPADVADIALALAHGIEPSDPTDPDRPRRQLRLAVDLLVAGLTHPSRQPEPH